jgi:phospholipase/carboxylesterase
MKNPHMTLPVVAWGRSLAEARVAVIALHGRAQHPGDIQAVGARIGLPDCAWLAPTAPDNSWYPDVFTAPLAANEPKLSQSLASVGALVGEVMAAGIGRERIVLMGFSQGACMVAEYALRHPERYGALLVLTGSAIGPEGTPRLANAHFRNTPVLVSGATQDPWIPVERMRDTARLFADRGAVVEECYYAGSDHLVSDEEITVARLKIAAIG